MQLSPLQSRLAASLGAPLLLFAFYLLFYSPRFALAGELGDAALGGQPVLDIPDGQSDAQSISNTQSIPDRQPILGKAPVYESEFTDDGALVGEMQVDVMPLTSNIPARLSLQPGASATFVFAGDAPSEGRLELRHESKESDLKESLVYISANTCRYPEGEGEAPQLRATVSPNGDGGGDFDEGAFMRMVNGEGNVYITITAPNGPELVGEYTLELAVSTDGWYHSYNADDDVSELHWVDSDSQGTLLRTRSLGLDGSPSDLGVVHDTIKDDPPYTLFLEKDGSNELNGVRRSYCGLQTYAKISALKHGKVTTTTMGHVPGPKQQFHIKGLSAGSVYNVILVHTGRRTLAKRQMGQVGGGGHVIEARQVDTKSGDNCAIPTDLEFCTDIDYAVPANPTKFNSSSLGKFYEDYVTKMFGYFNNSLAQIPCQAPDEARYSLARDCNDCSRAYKTWLCTVAFPRCEDFNSTKPYTQARNVAQAFPNSTRLASAGDFTHPAEQVSRNLFIDEGIAPGPYREILPCDRVCYLVVQSCPAALGFTCPMEDMKSYERSYAPRRSGLEKDVVPCNFPGHSTDPSGVGVVRVSVGVVVVAVVFAVIL